MNTIDKPQGCGFWHEESSILIEQASFLVLTPDAILVDRGNAAFPGAVDIEAATSLGVRANFPLKPDELVAGFYMDDRDWALDALLRWKRTRPIFFKDISRRFEYHATSVPGLIDEMRFHDIPMDQLDEIAAQQIEQQRRLQEFFMKDVTVSYVESDDSEVETDDK